MKRRGSAFWNGPGLLLSCLGFVVFGGGLLILVIVGPPFWAGIALILGGVIVVWGHGGFGEYAYTKAQHSYIWPRDPEKMKPNAELEAGLMTVWAVFLGIAMIVAGLVTLGGD